MPRIHVCSLQRLNATVAETGAADVVTLIKDVTRVSTPPMIAPERHLTLHFSDISAPQDGEILAGDDHVAALLAFVTRWDRASPLVIHCYAGVSRSTAGAFIAACALRPDLSEARWAETIRAASPTASPNPRLVALADRQLARQGRMIAAIESLGRGRECYEGIPFRLEIGARGAGANPAAPAGQIRAG